VRNVTRAFVGALVASLVAAAASVYALPPTAADFAACNADAQVAVKAGTASPTTMDYVRVESARTDSAATWTTWVGPIRMGVLGSPADGAGDRWDHGRRVSGDISHVHATEWILRRPRVSAKRGSSTSVIRRTVQESEEMGKPQRLPEAPPATWREA
jgi:hypothetical protein